MLIVLGPKKTVAQTLSIELGKPEVALNEHFSLTIVSEGQPIKEYSKFPDISGFTKAGRTVSTTTTSIAGGETSQNQRMVQRYKPTREGIFHLKPFSIRVNGQSVDSEGITITVGPESETPPADENEQLAEDPEIIQQPLPSLAELAPHGQEAFLRLDASKKNIYTGEGVHISLYFYLAFSERNLLEFHEFGKQLPELVKKIRQPNVWEEFFEQYEIEPENLEIEGKPYLRFKLYEAVYFPLTAQPLLFPSLNLQMIRYRMLPQRSFDGPARVAEKVSYQSAPLIVAVKELPPHPLRDKVAVGNFKLREGLDKANLKTRQGFHYLFQIEGVGNISAVSAPALQWPNGLAAYAPSVKQYTQRSYGRITGSKGFDYFITPGEPGEYDFSKFAYWVYFNPVSARYDTLKSDLKINVSGPSSRNLAIASATADSYYQNIGKSSNKLLSIENFDTIKIYANLVLAALLVIVVFIYFKK